MIYFSGNEKLYAFDEEETGICLKYTEKKSWQLADVTYAYLVSDDSFQTIPEKKVMEMTNYDDPRTFVKIFKEKYEVKAENKNIEEELL